MPAAASRKANHDGFGAGVYDPLSAIAMAVAAKVRAHGRRLFGGNVLASAIFLFLFLFLFLFHFHFLGPFWPVTVLDMLAFRLSRFVAKACRAAT